MLSSLDFKESHSLIPPSNLNLIDLKSPQVRCGRETTREAADAEGRAHKYARMHAHVFEYLTGAYWCRSLAAVQCAFNTTDSSTQHIKQNTASPIDPWEFIKTLFSNAVWCLSFLEWEAAGNLIKLMDKKTSKDVRFLLVCMWAHLISLLQSGQNRPVFHGVYCLHTMQAPSLKKNLVYVHT